MRPAPTPTSSHPLTARLARVVAVLCVSLCALGVVAQTTTLLTNTGPEKRFALVIGNGAYPSAPLPNPVNDVRAMSRALGAAGFDVVAAENVGRIQLLRLVREFGDKLLNSGGVGVFYFAGHGLQIKGRNYLVPVDAQVTGEDEASYDSMDADFVLQKMGEAKNRVNLIILDACRNNPFVKTRSTANGGLATMDAPVGSLIAYATAPGSVASDGTGSNGLYTEHLVSAISQRGIPVEEVFKQVRSNVRRDSQGKQVPWENTALEGQFFFFPSESVVGVQQQNPHTQAAPGALVLESGAAERTAWEEVRRGSVTEVEQFLRRYPNGKFAVDARDRLVALRAAQASVAHASAAPSTPANVSAPVPAPVATPHAIGAVTAAPQAGAPVPVPQPGASPAPSPAPSQAPVAVPSPAPGMVSLAALASQIAARPPHTPSPSASPSTGKISLEALSTMAASQGAAHSAAQNAAHANPAHSNPINASPSPATAAPTPAPAAPPIALVTKPSPPATSAATTTPLIGVGRLWNYTVSTKERQDKTEQIRLESVSGGWQRLSDGGEIHEDGRVRAVRLGSYLVRAVSDESFLRLPLRPGMSGANTAQVIDAQGRSANARVIWRTEANGTMVKLVASVDGVTFVMRYEALFDSAQLLPVRYESELKNRPASGPPISVVARLVP